MEIAWVCGECRAPVLVRRGPRKGTKYYNCAACGLRVSWAPGSKGEPKFPDDPVKEPVKP